MLLENPEMLSAIPIAAATAILTRWGTGWPRREAAMAGLFLACALVWVAMPGTAGPVLLLWGVAMPVCALLRLGRGRFTPPPGGRA